MMIICTLFFNFSDEKKKIISTFLSAKHSVQICIILKWLTKNGLIVIKVFKRSQEKQSDCSNCVPYGLRAAALQQQVTF